MDSEPIDMIDNLLVYIIRKKRRMQELGIELEQELSDRLDRMIIELNSDVINI